MVQRYESTEWGQMDADSEGGWVSYLAHVAEVQRVREGWYEAQSEAWEQGFHHALNAAREAVAALEPLLDVTKSDGGYDCCGCVTPGYLWTDALAAIDALMVGRSGNPGIPPSAEEGEQA